MLSINIPVYNIEVYGLVFLLNEQAKKLGIDYEIRIYDDGSTVAFKELNRKIKPIERVVYFELPKNLGRAAIRNKMGRESVFKYLLFIDADSEPVSENYLKNYLVAVEENTVICGGTAYKPVKPEPEKILRWVYGRKREAVSAEIRNQKKGFIITSNNFLIEKQIFAETGFREEVRKYGHEDTLLGFDLAKKGIRVKHIDNPVFHTGLESSADFLQKTRTGLQSLYFISNELLPNDETFFGQVHFLRQFRKLRRFIPLFFLKFLNKIFGYFLEKNLTGKNPRLFFFDLYKVLIFAGIKKPHSKN